MKGMKTQNSRGQTLYHPLLSQDLPDLRYSRMNYRSSKIEGISVGTNPPTTTPHRIKKNGMVPATSSEELAKILEQHPEVKDIFIDGVERAVQRSQKYDAQKKDYSGKKKKHTKKNIALTSEKLILAIWKTEWWSKHDYTLLKETGFLDVLVQHSLWVDLWFLWIQKDHPNKQIFIPMKKPKNQELTQAQKDDNKVISSIRVIVEHFFARIKKYHVLSNTYRSRLYWNFYTVRTNRKEQIMLIICWLCNLQRLIR